MSTHPLQPRRRSPMRIIAPIVLVVLVVVLIVVVRRRGLPHYSEAQMLRSIHATALRHSDKAGVPDGGPLGPWWISASEGDPFTGELRNFSITTEAMIIAAQTARIRIDPYADTFMIDMEHVVMTRFESGPDAEMHSLVELDHYRLGPAPFHVDIRPDAGRSARPPASPVDASPLAGVDPPSR